MIVNHNCDQCLKRVIDPHGSEFSVSNNDQFKICRHL